MINTPADNVSEIRSMMFNEIVNSNTVRVIQRLLWNTINILAIPVTQYGMVVPVDWTTDINWTNVIHNCVHMFNLCDADIHV